MFCIQFKKTIIKIFINIIFKIHLTNTIISKFNFLTDIQTYTHRIPKILHFELSTKIKKMKTKKIKFGKLIIMEEAYFINFGNLE